MKTFKFDINTLVRENVRVLSPYSSARDEFKDFDQEMVFLDANENPFENGVNRYPDPQQRKVKALLAAQKNVQAAQILLGNGSDEVLDLLFRAFCEPHKDAVISLPPTYGMYGVLAGINAVQNIEVLLDENFEPNVTRILKAVTGTTKILFLCSPNNPTGNCFNEDSVVYLLENFKGIVVIDEAYIDFASTKGWLSNLDNFPNLVVTQTLSKAYGMAGIRMGILYASETIISVLNKIKPPYNVNELTQQRALERLQDFKKIQEEITSILTQRDRLVKALDSIGFISKIYETEANFVLVKVDNANLRYAQLLEAGIVIRNRSTQALCDNTLRFTIGTEQENTRLVSVLKGLD